MKKIFTLLLTAALLFSFASCTSQTGAKDTGTLSSGTSAPTQSDNATQAPEPSPAEKIDINVLALKGPTGMGMAKLNADTDAGTAANNYKITYSSDPTVVTAALLNGSADIAAVPVNLASVLYNKTNGGVKIAAVNTLGVLYMLENGSTIQSVSDLKGKTIYATGQASTPEYILRYILTENGIDPDKDVTIEYKADHSELATLMSSGEVVLGMLPEPNVTAVLSGNADVRIALNLTEEWDKTADDGSALVQGVLVVRDEFAKAHPDAVKAFLADYRASVEYTNANTEDASKLIEQYGIVPKAAVALKALPNCNITFVTGSDMVSSVTSMLNVLFAAAPASVGGSVPDEALFFTAE